MVDMAMGGVIEGRGSDHPDLNRRTATCPM